MPESRVPPLLRLPGVYRPQEDTHLLLRALAGERLCHGARLLDLCTGSGVLAVGAALLGAEVTAVDIGRRAVLTARLNARLRRQRVRVRRGDLLAAVHGERYELIVCNPPYVPAPPGRRSAQGAARAWDAGVDGRSVLDRVCDTAPQALDRGGVLLLVQSALAAPHLTLARLRHAGLRADVLDRQQVPLGPVLVSRRPWLERRGLLPHESEPVAEQPVAEQPASAEPTGHARGTKVTEELVVIRAERT